MDGFSPRTGPTLVQVTQAPYFIEIPMYAHDRAEAAKVAGAIVARAHAIAPEHIDAAGATIRNKEERTECLLLCNLLHWTGHRCREPYGHEGPCPERL